MDHFIRVALNTVENAPRCIGMLLLGLEPRTYRVRADCSSQLSYNSKNSKHIEVCHIRPIADYPPDTLLSVINDTSNLIGLCPNCHWEFDHKQSSAPART